MMAGRGWSISTKKRDGQFLLKYKHPQTGTWKQHRMPLEVSTRRDAERYAKQWYETFRAHLEKPRRIDLPEDAGPTVTELANRWIELRQRFLREGRIRPATLKQDKGCLNEHVLPALGPLTASELGTGRLRAFFRSLSGKRAPHTVRNVASVLKTMLDDVIAEEDWAPGLTQNPMRTKAVRRLVPPPRKLSGNKNITIPMNDVVALLKSDYVPVERKARYVLAVVTGLRDGELAGLAWMAIHLQDRIPYLEVQQSLALVGGLMEPKTLNGTRDIPLHDVALDMLCWWWAHGWETWVGRKPTPSDPVLPDRAGKWWRPRSGQLLREDLMVAGCSTVSKGHKITFHAFRRTFSSALERSRRVKDLTKQVLMGHSHARVDHDHYDDTELPKKRQAIRTIKLSVTLEELLAAGYGEEPTG